MSTGDWDLFRARGKRRGFSPATRRQPESILVFAENTIFSTIFRLSPNKQARAVGFQKRDFILTSGVCMNVFITGKINKVTVWDDMNWVILSIQRTFSPEWGHCDRRDSLQINSAHCCYTLSLSTFLCVFFPTTPYNQLGIKSLFTKYLAECPAQLPFGVHWRGNRLQPQQNKSHARFPQWPWEADEAAQRDRQFCPDLPSRIQHQQHRKFCVTGAGLTDRVWPRQVAAARRDRQAGHSTLAVPRSRRTCVYHPTSYHSGLYLHSLPHGYVGDPPAPEGVWQRGQACQTLVSRAALTCKVRRWRTVAVCV